MEICCYFDTYVRGHNTECETQFESNRNRSWSDSSASQMVSELSELRYEIPDTRLRKRRLINSPFYILIDCSLWLYCWYSSWLDTHSTQLNSTFDKSVEAKQKAVAFVRLAGNTMKWKIWYKGGQEYTQKIYPLCLCVPQLFGMFHSLHFFFLSFFHILFSFFIIYCDLQLNAWFDFQVVPTPSDQKNPSSDSDFLTNISSPSPLSLLSLSSLSFAASDRAPRWVN